MTDPVLFSPSQAADITGISVATQRDWRRRGFLPANEGGWTRFGFRDVCRLRLMRAFLDADLPVSVAVAHISDRFVDALASEVKLYGKPGFDGRPRPIEDDPYAVIGQFEGVENINDLYYSDVILLEHMAELPGRCPDRRFKSFLVISLAVLAADLVAKGARGDE